MFCTLRTWNDKVAEAAIANIKKIAQCVAETAGGSATYTEKKHYPILQNHERLTALMRESAARALGEDKILVNSRGMGGEDFSYFASEKPGCMLRLGVVPPDRVKIPGVHNECFLPDEDALEVGVRVLLQFILDHHNGISL
jgi:amidohydrolase